MSGATMSNTDPSNASVPLIVPQRVHYQCVVNWTCILSPTPRRCWHWGQKASTAVDMLNDWQSHYRWSSVWDKTSWRLTRPNRQ